MVDLPWSAETLATSWSFKLNGIFWTRFCGDFETKDKINILFFLSTPQRMKKTAEELQNTDIYSKWVL